MTDALAFSQAADVSFQRLAARLADTGQRRLLFGRQLNQARFERIRSAAARYIIACVRPGSSTLSEPALLAELVAQKSSLPNLTPGGLLLPKREQLLEFNLLHKALSEMFAELRIEDLAETIHLPVNVRVVDGNVDAQRDNRPYATSKFHTDVWAGEPMDAVAILLPLFGDVDNITVEFGEMPPAREREFMRLLDDYGIGQELLGDIYEGWRLALGSINFFDARLLHRTVRKQPGVRVSVDFRFRLKTEGIIRDFIERMTARDRLPNYVPFETWLGVGTTSLMMFDETMEEARARHRIAVSSSKHPSAYRLVNLLSGEQA